MVVFAAGLSTWAVLSFALVALAAAPLASLFPLLVLFATFEAVFALHVGVERVGRYLQVFYDDRWETTAMAFGQPLAGTGSDPLFAAVIAVATVCNLIPVFLAEPIPVEITVIGLIHAAFIVRIGLARRAASRQRAADIARFREIKAKTADSRQA